MRAVDLLLPFLALVLPLSAAAQPAPPEPAALEAASAAALRGPPGCTRWALRWAQEGRLGLIPFAAHGTAEGELRDGRWTRLELGAYEHGNSEVHIDLGAGPLPFLPPMVGQTAAERGAGSLLDELLRLVSGEATTLDLKPAPGGGWIETRGLRDGGRMLRGNTVTIEHDADLHPRVWALDARRASALGPGRLTEAQVRVELGADGSPRSEQVELKARLVLALVLRRTLELEPLGRCA